MKLGFLSTLTIIFVIAKLIGIINWSWWLCFLPAIISVTILILCFIICAYAEYRKQNTD